MRAMIAVSAPLEFYSIKHIHVNHTHTTVLRLGGICPGKPG